MVAVVVEITAGHRAVLHTEVLSHTRRTRTVTVVITEAAEGMIASTARRINNRTNLITTIRMLRRHIRITSHTRHTSLRSPNMDHAGLLVDEGRQGAEDMTLVATAGPIPTAQEDMAAPMVEAAMVEVTGAIMVTRQMEVMGDTAVPMVIAGPLSPHTATTAVGMGRIPMLIHAAAHTTPEGVREVVDHTNPADAFSCLYIIMDVAFITTYVHYITILCGRLSGSLACKPKMFHCNIT